jgi:hypothetical protein
MDRASAILKVYLPSTGWKTYRLPKATHTQDHAYTTEWPRIREVESERWLMNASGHVLRDGLHDVCGQCLGNTARLFPSPDHRRLLLMERITRHGRRSDHTIGRPKP